MNLTPDDKEVIKKAADLLDCWLKDLIKNNFGDMGCYIPLHAWYETVIVRAVDILIENEKMTQLGKSIKKECDDLLEKARLLSSMDEQNTSDIQSKQAELSLLARRIIPRFRRVIEKLPTKQEKKGLSPTYERAYQSYMYAEQEIVTNTPNTEVTDRAAYDWLKENGIEDDVYDLPAFDTWRRYVRKGRKHYRTQKNTPRAGRSHNIPKASDLESLGEITHKSKNKAD